MRFHWRLLSGILLSLTGITILLYVHEVIRPGIARLQKEALLESRGLDPTEYKFIEELSNSQQFYSALGVLCLFIGLILSFFNYLWPHQYFPFSQLISRIRSAWLGTYL